MLLTIGEHEKIFKSRVTNISGLLLTIADSNTTLSFSPLTYRKRHCVLKNDNSQFTKLPAKERAFVTSHVHIHVRRKLVHWKRWLQC